MATTPSTHRVEWSDALIREFAAATGNGRVGNILVSETERFRIWLIQLEPGARLPFHTHVLDYFWVATTAGRALSRHREGQVTQLNYTVGLTGHLRFGPGECMTHDLENNGETMLCFTTVEDKQSANAPLPL